jgi:hypothetical protein
MVQTRRSAGRGIENAFRGPGEGPPQVDETSKTSHLCDVTGKQNKIADKSFRINHEVSTFSTPYSLSVSRAVTTSTSDKNRISKDFRQLSLLCNMRTVQSQNYSKLESFNSQHVQMFLKKIGPRDYTKVAIKRMERNDDNENEIQIMQKLKGKNGIITYIDSEIFEKSISLVMEAGQMDLKQIVRTIHNLDEFYYTCISL